MKDKIFWRTVLNAFCEASVYMFAVFAICTILQCVDYLKRLTIASERISESIDVMILKGGRK